MKKKRIISFLLAAVMVVSSAIPTAAAGADTLTNQVLDLSFENNLNDGTGKNSNIKMKDRNRNDVTATYVDGIIGRALQFNGSNYVDMGRNAELQPKNLTLSFWMKPNADMGNGEQVITWSKREWYTDGWYLSSENGNVPLTLSVGPELTGQQQPYKVSISGVTRADFFPTGEWTHVVVTYDSVSKDVKFYRNGMMCDTIVNYAIAGDRTGVLGSDSTTMKSLGWNGEVHGGTSLNSVLDEYQLFNDVANIEEVIGLYEESGRSFDKKAVAQADADALAVPAETKSNLLLLTTGANGSKITWSTSNASVITADGVVTRPAVGQPDATATLTATVSFAGGEAVTKKFTVTVSAMTGDSSTGIVPSSVMGDVTLVDDYLVNAAQKEVDYLLSMDSEKFLYEFYKVAGLTPTTTSGYGGWERTNGQNFRGHTFGHYMSALSMSYLSSDNANEKAAMMTEMREAVEGLKKCQQAYAVRYPAHAGYISAFPQGVLRRVDGVASPTADDGTVLVPYYNLHKVLAGLVDIAKNADDAYVQETALEVAEGFGEFLYNRMLQLTNKNAMLSIEYGGINEALYELYNLTGNDHYKTAAQYFDETTLFQQLANNQDVLNGKHANTTIPKLTGAVKRYTVLTENDAYYNALTATEKSELNMYLTAAENFFDIVVDHHTYVTGGNSQSEHFHVADMIGADATGSNPETTCETCNTYNMLKLAKALFEVTKDKKYMDYFENTYINAILSSQNPETGTTMYFQPMAPGYNKVFNRPHDEFWCCTGTGMENFSKLGDNIYYTEGTSVYVHMFFSSEYTDAANNLKLTQTANMPNEDTATFTVEAANGGSLREGTVLRLRKPDWLAGTAEIKVNGKAVALDEQNGYYVVDVQAGDEISYTMPMKVVAYDMPDKANMVAFKYGPVVLSTGLGTDNIERSGPNGILVRVGTPDPKAKTTILMQNYTDVEAWKADVEQNLVRIEDSADGQVQFKLQNTDSPELTYTPHYMRYKESYGLYMFIEGEDSQAAQDRILSEKEKLRDEEMSVDSLYTFDNNNYEFAKNLQASANSSVGTYSGRQYRDAQGGGWFSYDLAIDKNADHNYLNCTFYSGDRSRRFEIIVDGTTLESYRFADAPSANQFFEHVIEIPANLVAAADNNNITVRFSSVNNSLVGGLFGIRVTTETAYSTDAAMKGLSFNVGTLSPAFSGSQTEYTLTVPAGTDLVEMTATPNVGSGLIYVNDVLIDDTKVRNVSLSDGQAYLKLTSVAQDHNASKEYIVTIVTEGEEKPKVLAMFDFDDETDGFKSQNAIAAFKSGGTLQLQDHDGGKALYLGGDVDGTRDYLEVTSASGASLLTNVKEMTISFQAKPVSSDKNWAFYAAPNTDTQQYPNEHYVGGLIKKGEILAERYDNENGRPATATVATTVSDWTYITIVHTETETILYVNGVERARQSSVHDLRDILGNSSILYIGRANWEGGEYYTGLIDNYLITSYAMTAQEVADLVANGGLIETAELASIAVTAPTKVDYVKGEALDTTGMKVTASYSDGTSKEITEGYEVSGYDADKTGEQVITVTYEGKTATFNVTVEEIVKVLPFEDVKEGSWYYEAVYNNYFANLMTGKTETLFAPKEALTRAQFALILYRMEGEPDVTSDKKFDDVSAGTWYTDAVLWAYEKGIITGYEGTNNFGPHDNIMREQMAVMMYRYAKTKDLNVAADADLSKFADVGKVGAYAEEAMKWAVGNGIITGKDEVTLDPRGNTIRAEAAVVIDRFMDNYAE